MDNNLEFRKIISIKRIPKKQKVYNFNVPGYENYIANGFVVHNCENYKISQSTKDVQLYFFHYDDIAKKALEHGCKSVCMTYNEPTIYYEYLMELSKAARKNNLKFILKTNAYLNKEPWSNVCDHTDAMNIDWKGSEKLFKFITSAKKYVCEDRIKEAYNKNVHIEISVPLYYEEKDLEEEMAYLGRFISSIDRRIPCHLLRISPSYKYDHFVFNNSHLKQAEKILSQYIDNIHA